MDKQKVNKYITGSVINSYHTPNRKGYKKMMYTVGYVGATIEDIKRTGIDMGIQIEVNWIYNTELKITIILRV